MSARDSRTERLRASLMDSYTFDPATGLFRWKPGGPNARRKMVGLVGNLDEDGYLLIRVPPHGTQKAHRMAWLAVYSQLPQGQIDHRNGVRDDNRIENLRACTPAENARNRKRAANNVTGFKGVGWHKPSNGFRARIMANGVRVNLGVFDTPQAAYDAYLSAASKLHGDFARAA